MAIAPFDRRRSYQREVSALRHRGEHLAAAGATVEQIARELVTARNALKQRYRDDDASAVVVLLEARNSAKYGDPIGPSPEWLFARYGSWELVIDAACRPARLVD